MDPLLLLYSNWFLSKYGYGTTNLYNRASCRKTVSFYLFSHLVRIQMSSKFKPFFLCSIIKLLTLIWHFINSLKNALTGRKKICFFLIHNAYIYNQACLVKRNLSLCPAKNPMSFTRIGECIQSTTSSCFVATSKYK